MKVLITGSQGFVGTYLCQELLNNGYEVIGVDNYSKYGKVIRPHDNHKNFTFYELDVLDPKFKEIMDIHKPEQVVTNAAMIGGISYFHEYAYDLIAQNERLTAQVFDSAIKGYKDGWLKRIIVVSSSMVFEKTKNYPTKESDLENCPPPLSTYGFQKLSVEYFAKGAYEQYGLPYTIVRPFNCVGVGEEDSISAHEVTSGNIKLMMSHVLPDLVNKTLKGQDPLHILGDGDQIRCYTNGKDLARGIRLVIESESAINNDFNISTPVSTSVIELAEEIWKQLKPGDQLRVINDKPYHYDVQKRIPDVTKAEKILGFKAEITLEESVKEVINYIKNK